MNFMAFQLGRNLKFLTRGRHLEIFLSYCLLFSLVVPKLLRMRTPKLLVMVPLGLQFRYRYTQFEGFVYQFCGSPTKIMTSGQRLVGNKSRHLKVSMHSHPTFLTVILNQIFPKYQECVEKNMIQGETVQGLRIRHIIWGANEGKAHYCVQDKTH